MIKDCVANFHCKKYKVIKEGDHFLFICKIVEIQIDNTKKPLIYFNSKSVTTFPIPSNQTFLVFGSGG